MKKIFKLRIESNRIELEGSDPQIWREFLVPSNTTFYILHHIFQIVMGWENYHLYEFTMDSYRICQQFEDDGFNGPHKIIDSKRITIGDVLKTKDQKLEYLYDVGDCWRHSLRLDMVIDGLTIPFPISCAGKLNCPSEDVGSLSGHYDFLKIMAKPKHPEHKYLKK